MVQISAGGRGVFFLGGRRKGVQLGRAAFAGFVTVDSPYSHSPTLLIQLTRFCWNFL